jgi:iron complex outermembrane recepter protein
MKGVDLDGFISPFPAFRINFAGSWFDGKIEPANLTALAATISSSSHFDYAPKWSYSLGAQYTFPGQVLGGDLTAKVDYYWVDAYKVSLPTYWSHHLVNASLDLDNIGGKPLTAEFFVQNVTNEEYLITYESSGLSPGISTGVYAPPRMYGFRLRYDFSM